MTETGSILAAAASLEANVQMVAGFIKYNQEIMILLAGTVLIMGMLFMLWRGFINIGNR